MSRPLAIIGNVNVDIIVGRLPADLASRHRIHGGP